MGSNAFRYLCNRIVEDDVDVRETYRQWFAFAGLRVAVASDGPAALQRVTKDPPDLLILDLALPTLDGLSVLEEMAAHVETRQVPIVIVTGSDNALDGVDVKCILRKPVDPD